MTAANDNPPRLFFQSFTCRCGTPTHQLTAESLEHPECLCCAWERQAGTPAGRRLRAAAEAGQRVPPVLLEAAARAAEAATRIIAADPRQLELFAEPEPTGNIAPSGPETVAAPQDGTSAGSDTGRNMKRPAAGLNRDGPKTNRRTGPNMTVPATPRKRASRAAARMSSLVHAAGGVGA